MKNNILIKALEVFHENALKVKAYLSHPEMSVYEKNIIMSWLMLRDNKPATSIKLVEKIPQVNELVNAQVNLLLACAHNNLNEFKKAKYYIQLAYDFNQSIHSRIHFYLLWSNSCIIFSNLKDLKNFKNSLEELKKIGFTNQKEKITYFKHFFNYSIAIDDFKTCEELIITLDALKNQMSDHQLINFYIDKFNYYVLINNLELAEKIIEEYKTARKFSITENFKYMKSLLLHLKYNSPIYLYEKDFRTDSYLFWQIKVIQSFEQNDIKNVNLYWSKLRNDYPELYGDNFHFKGPANVFSLCLKKYLLNSNENRISHHELSKEDNVISILSKNNSQISKEELHQLIYHKKLQDKNDLMKLAKLISRVREKTGFEIKTRKGCYILVKKAS
jgi:hypothetical protein